MPKRKAAAKRKRVADARRQAGNVGSGDQPGLARPWTDEEMAAAKPLPLPTVDPAPKVPSLPHAGKGETKPAGRPEDEREPGR
jgi:hypothetical protein